MHKTGVQLTFLDTLDEFIVSRTMEIPILHNIQWPEELHSKY